jgi:DamX protein
MSEFTSPSAEPNYIARLALHSAPFNASVEPNMFFKGEQVEQRYNLLLHLIRASDKVGFLSVEQGLGKSTLLAQLQRNKTDDLKICRINGHASLTSMEIIMQCLSAFGVDENDVKFSNDHLILLKDRLSGLRQLNIKPLLLIDDIDLVSEESLMVLMDCLSWQSNDAFLLHAVFTSTQVLPALANIHGRLQQIDLPALSEQEVLSYLNYRLQVVGYKGESVFNVKELKQCYRQTAGIPALINQWAHQHLLGMKSTSANPIKSKIKFNVGCFMPLLRWSGLGVLVSTLILLLLFQDAINDFFAPKVVEEMTLEKPFTVQEESLATVILDEDKVTSSGQAERDELTSLVAELAEVGMVVEPEQVPDGISPDEINPKTQAIVTKPILAAKPVLQTQPAPAIHQKEWILQQSVTHYTFQLMGSWDKQEVVAFLEKYALAGDVAEFESMRNGRVWYALIYGVYDNKQAALDASSKWPAPINTLPSWLRRFDSVQQQIEKTAH